jgi:hypothetical protein
VPLHDAQALLTGADAREMQPTKTLYFSKGSERSALQIDYFLIS